MLNINYTTLSNNKMYYYPYYNKDTNNTFNSTCSRNNQYSEIPQKQINFQGHMLCTRMGKRVFINQTGFFRGLETLKQLINYLRNIENPKILVGACSTGEEAVTLQMLLPKAHTKGFDICEEAIEMARSGLFNMQIYGRNDSFLLLNPAFLYNNPDKKSFHELFHKNLRLHSDSEIWMNQVTYQYLPQNKIEYTVGDALDLENVAQGEKYDVFMFNNAIYQLLGELDENLNYFPKEKETQKQILQKFIKGVNKILNKNGFFVFSKEQHHIGQHDITMDMNILSDILNENGFLKMYSPEGNIWKKVKDI